MTTTYENLINHAANALISWEKSSDFAAVARFYQLSYDYTCKAIALQVKEREDVFRDISRKVLELRTI